MNVPIFIIFCAISGIVMSENKARYDNYQLIRVNLKTNEHVKLFQELEEKSDSFIFYGHARNIGQSLTILVAAHK